ncbi:MULTISPECIES: HNH endonuclease signature motif containing protein [unclassified Nocardioides]|uniref:HNH endonuclease signature motif containing protein n=1 Tax=unclassified Nocardioides TaxID=2615069 RepID=UPI0006F5C337|nr:MULTISPECIES: HNH endonuclease signature motif containing protein [unclassified Nocardioides]KRA32471.1 hypothetical protein ASD81_12985 [Nocardioides sp. Root614]KRA89125.1 hypothetical protein ASD84_13250 [Nocardioides sp. Root682]
MSSTAALDKAAAAVESAAELAQTQWDDLAGADAPEAAARIAQAKAMLDAAMLGVTARLEETHEPEKLGWASTKDFLTHVTGGHKGAGGGLVRAVDQLRDLPAVGDALKVGAISLTQARAIGSKVTTLPRVPKFRTAVADRMLDLVHTNGYDATDLQVAFGDVARELDVDGTLIKDDRSRERQERAAHLARHLGFSQDGIGGEYLRGYGSEEESELIKSVLMPLAAPVTTEPGACGGVPTDPNAPLLDENGHPTGTRCPDPTCAHDGKDPRDHGRRFWDALVEACRRLQSTDQLPHDHGASARIIVTIDQESLRQKVIDAGLARDGSLPSDQRLSANAVRRLACDAEIIPAVLGSDGQILDVGRARRLVTPAIWLALVLRDRHCAFPGCTRLPIACDAHHVVHWADGGATSLDNLMLICRKHHTLVHNTPWTVRIDPATGRPVWTRPPPIDLRDRLRYSPPRTAEEIAAAYEADRAAGRPPPRAA